MPVERHVPAAVSGRREAPGAVIRELFQGFLLEHAALTVATGPLEAEEQEFIPPAYLGPVEGFPARGLDAVIPADARKSLPSSFVELLGCADICAYVEVCYVHPDTDTSTIEAMLDAGLEDASRFAKGTLLDDRQPWLCLRVPSDEAKARPRPLLISFQRLEPPLQFDGRYLDFDDPSPKGERWRELVAEAGVLAEEVNHLDGGLEQEAAWERFKALTEAKPEFRELLLPPGLAALYLWTPFLSFGPVLHPSLDLPGLAPLPWSPGRTNPGRYVSFWHDHPERYYLDMRDDFAVLRHPLEGGTLLVPTGLPFEDWFADLISRFAQGGALTEHWRPQEPIGRPVEALDAAAFEEESLWGFDRVLFLSDVVRGVHPDADERWVRPFAANYEPDGDSDLFFARAVLTDCRNQVTEGMAGFLFEGDSEVEVEGFSVFDPQQVLHFGLGEDEEAVFLSVHDIERLSFAAGLPVTYEVLCGTEVLARGQISGTAVFDPDEDPTDWEGPSAFDGG
ncbi:hypothetical protein ACFL59_07515 [Planctomycetota bacterium]